MDYRLYLVTDRFDYTDEQFLSVVQEALQAGVTLVQLREKDISTRRFFQLAQAVKNLTDRYDVPLIINDRIDIALAVDAAGVHIGDDELPVKVAREILGPDKILGVSTKTVAASLAAQADGADYLGVGAIYPTQTKVVTETTSLDTLRDITAQLTIPVVAIGGINSENVVAFHHTGIQGISLVSAIMLADNVRQTVATLDHALRQINI